MKKFYDQLPQEIHVAVEYLVPSYLVTVGIDYFTKLEVNNVLTTLLVNLALIFLRQIKPRFERLSGK